MLFPVSVCKGVCVCVWEKNTGRIARGEEGEGVVEGAMELSPSNLFIVQQRFSFRKKKDSQDVPASVEVESIISTQTASKGSKNKKKPL